VILILSNKWDLTVDFVVTELRSRQHPFVRLNTEDLRSERATVELPDFHVSVSKNNVLCDLLDSIHVIWNRRPGKPYDDTPPPDRPSPATQRFVSDQWYSWLEALQLLRGVAWINHPHANDAMESKVRQLHAARSAGFQVPETLITNDPARVRGFLQRHSTVVAKALYAPLIEEPDQDRFIFSTLIDSLSEQDDQAVRECPVVFQEPIVPKTDIRVTVVGEMVFAARVICRTNEELAVDWRTLKEGVRFERCDLPEDLADRCRAFVRDAGLRFGAIDLAERHGSYYFFEINPNGEWGWLQRPTGLPIAESLCDLMVASDAP